MDIKKWFCLITALVCLSSCGPPGEHQTENDVTYARGFTIENKTGGKTILTDGKNQTFTILSPPSGSSPSKSEHTVYAPVKKVVCTSAPAVSLINTIGRTDSIAGVKLPEKSWHIEQIKSRMQTGDIALIGNGSHYYVDYERIVTINPDAIFSNIDHPARWEMLFKDRGIRNIAVCTHKEDSLLGQYEWIKMLGVFYNNSEHVNRLFNKRADRYRKLKNSIAKKVETPVVLWGSVLEHRASVPGGASYIANAIKDAGGHYALEKELENLRGGYIPCDLEMFYKRGRAADVFVLSTTKASGINRIDDLIRLNRMFANFKCVKTGNVWCYQPWLWQSVDKPDEVFKDIAALIHPEMSADVKIRYFEKLEP